MIKPDLIIRTHRRSLSLQITKTGDLVVHAPKRLSVDYIFNYIKEKEINHLDLAKMVDGYYYRLPYASLFYHFEEQTIKSDIKQILFNSLCLNNSKYFDFYQ